MAEVRGLKLLAGFKQFSRTHNMIGPHTCRLWERFWSSREDCVLPPPDHVTSSFQNTTVTDHVH